MNNQKEWIDPEKELPPCLKRVLFVVKNIFHEETVVGCYDSGYKSWTILERGYSGRDIQTKEIHCWRYIPEPPEANV